MVGNLDQVFVNGLQYLAICGYKRYAQNIATLQHTSQHSLYLPVLVVCVLEHLHLRYPFEVRTCIVSISSML